MFDNLPTELLDSRFVFKHRPVSVAADLRPVRRVILLLILVDACRGSSANLEQLHVLDWAIRDSSSRMTLLQFILGQRPAESSIVRFDPSLDRAVCLAVGSGVLLVTPISDGVADIPDFRVELTTRGREIINELSDDIFEVERNFLGALPRKLTKNDIHDLFTWGQK